MATDIALSAPAEGGTENQARLLAGLSRAIAAKGYAATTIADIVAEAAVSRRTFYECFPGKAECFMALYERLSLQGLDVLRRGLDPAQAWDRQIEQALGAYFAWMAVDVGLIRTMFIEILALGPAGLAARRRAQNSMAEFILATANRNRRGTSRVPRAVALALIGAIHELVLDRVEVDDPAGVRQLGPAASELVRKLFA